LRALVQQDEHPPSHRMVQRNPDRGSQVALLIPGVRASVGTGFGFRDFFHAPLMAPAVDLYFYSIAIY
jgi:hypothetical protein